MSASVNIANMAYAFAGNDSRRADMVNLAAQVATLESVARVAVKTVPHIAKGAAVLTELNTAIAAMTAIGGLP